MEAEAKQFSKTFSGGPFDPEQSKPSAGVGAMAEDRIGIYTITKPIKHYQDAIKIGRLLIVCCDLNGQTLAIANVYGWTGGRMGSVEAERTDDLFCICKLQFEELPPGPRMICGDFNGPLQAFPTLVEMMRSEGWTDIGADSAKCGGRPNQPTSHTNVTANETRIDYVIANEYIAPAIKTFTVD